VAPQPRTIIRLRIDSDRAIIEARQRGRQLAETAGFGVADSAVIATAISELAHTTLSHAKTGQITVKLAQQEGRLALTIVASDLGPALGDGPLAVDGDSGSLGLGLPGVKRLMDEFVIASSPRRGTRVTATKWRT
jgi:serine/threonine-protein kinase RsbT